MLFTRQERYGALVFNGRREAAFLRKQRKERERFPLLAEQIAVTQHSVDEERRRRIALANASEARMRQFDARVWRQARNLYFAQPGHVRLSIRAYCGISSHLHTQLHST